jgi:hypothetical protein
MPLTNSLPEFTGTTNTLNPLGIINPDKYGDKLSATVTVKYITEDPPCLSTYTFTWFKDPDAIPFQTYTSDPESDGTAVPDTASDLDVGKYKVHVVRNKDESCVDVEFEIRDIFGISIPSPVRSISRSRTLTGTVSRAGTRAGTGAVRSTNKGCIPCSGKPSSVPSRNVTISTAAIPVQSTQFNTRDLVVGGVIVPINPEDPDEPPVISNILFCNDDKFTMMLTDLPIDEGPQAPSNYPLHLVINNVTLGGIYIFDITLSEVIPTYTYNVPTTFGPGYYNVTVTDAFGNQETYTFIVTAPNIVELKVVDPCPCVPCFGGSIDVDIQVIFNNQTLWCPDVKYYVRVKKDGVVINPTTGAPVNGGNEVADWFELVGFTPGDVYTLTASAGLYEVSIIQVCGSVCNIEDRSCEKTVTFKVCQPTKVRSKICKSKLRVDCNGDSDGFVDIWVEGGTPPYTLTLFVKDGASYVPTGIMHVNGLFTGLPVGCYKVVVTDSHDCPADDLLFNITEPELINVMFSNPVGDKCGQKFSVQVYVTGGTPFGCCKIQNDCGCGEQGSAVAPNPNAYMYTWIKDCKPNVIIGTGSFITCLEPGNYTVTVKDSNCCVGTGHITITAKLPSCLCVRVNKHNCKNECLFTIDVDVDCGIPPFVYIINGETLDDDIACYEFKANQCFRLKVTDSRGISGTTTF